MPWSWACASAIGSSHLRTGIRCQDAHRCLEVDGTLIAIASDGAGSAARGGEGAVLVCRTLATELAARVRSARDLDDDALTQILDRVRDRIAHVAASQSAAMRDFAATAVVIIAGPVDTLIMHVGDGAAAIRHEGRWQVGSWPDAGEFAGTTFFVTDDGGAKLRVTRLGHSVDEIAALTDGLERLALSFADERVHVPFFEGMMRPLAARTTTGRSPDVSAMLRSYLASQSVCSRTDDDKTIVLARRA